MEDRRKQTGKKGSFYNIDDKIDHVAKPKTTKMILDFCVDESVSIKSFAVKEKKEVGANANVCKAFFNELYLRHFRNILFS